MLFSSKEHGTNGKSQCKGLPCRAHFLALEFLAVLGSGVLGSGVLWLWSSWWSRLMSASTSSRRYLASGIEIVPGRERKPRRNGAYCERDNAPSAFWIGAAV